MLATIVAELHSFMQCFGSCPFFRGSWIGTSDEVANIHMKTDAENLVITARTFLTCLNKKHPQDLNVSKGSLFREYSWSCSHSIPDVLSILFNGGISKSRQLDVIGETGMLLDVDIHLDYRTFMEIRLSYLYGVEHSCAQGKRYFSLIIRGFFRVNSTR